MVTLTTIKRLEKSYAAWASGDKEKYICLFNDA